MTREEAIEYLKRADVTVGREIKTKTAKALEMAIKALEQEPKSEWEHDHAILKAYSDGASEVLDKIRAEIETKYGQCDICEYDAISGWEQVSDIADILQIIDKYKAESEQTDGNDD